MKILKQRLWQEDTSGANRITPFNNFYEAEDYHKNYFEKNKNIPYCSLVIDPKINKLMQEYRRNVKEEYKSK